MTRDPTSPPDADDAQGPLSPRRRRPPRAGTGPAAPRVPSPDPRATGPQPTAASRFPLGLAPPEGAAGSVPGYEFEGRRPRAARATTPLQPGQSEDYRRAGRGPARDERPEPEPAGGEPRRFRYSPTVSQPVPGPPPAWPDTAGPAPRPGFEFDDRAQQAALPGADPPRPGLRRDAGLRQAPAPGERPASANQQATARPDPRATGAEWAKLLRSLLPQPVRPSWSREFLAGLEFRGWVMRVGVPILTIIVFGVAVVVIAGANSGNAGPAPPAAALGFPPATLAGSDFTAAPGGRGISQSLGRVASDGADIVAVGSQTGARIARAQFFFSPNDGRSWVMGSVQTPSGGVPPPGHAARYVAGGQGKWVAVGPGSIWTSPDGRTWTLTASAGMPLRPGDQISELARTAAGFIAVGANVPGGDQANTSPVIFLSADGISWRRLDAGQLGLPSAGTGRVLDLRYVAVAGKLILIAGDVATTEVVGKPRHTVSIQAGGAWLSSDGGSAWAAATPPAGAGGQPQITGVAAAGDGFVLVKPATVDARPAVEVYRSANGTAWTQPATLGTPAGLVTGLVSGGPDGAVITGQAGQALTAFVSANGASWQPTGVLGRAASETLSGVAMTQRGAVVTGTAAAAATRQPVLTVLAAGTAADQVDVAKIPGAFDPQLAVDAVAANGGMQVVVGSANGYPAAWASADGGGSWTRALGVTPAVFGRAGVQQLTSVTHGAAGWLAVGGVVAGAAPHPVVVSSADGGHWQAADTEGAFGGRGLSTEQAAAGAGGYVIVGYQDIPRSRGGQTGPDQQVAAAWWSAGVTGWQRAGDAAPGALDGTSTSKQMLAVTAVAAGFVAVGSAGDQAAAWTSPDGRTWRQASLPVPMGSTRTVLQHVASRARTVVAVGTALTTTGQQVPFAASSADGGASWTESALPMPAGHASVTALAAAGDGFTAAGTFGTTAGHQDVVVWTSANGTTWKAVTPTGPGLTGPGIQAITGLTATGNTLTGVGFSASPASEAPVFWQSPIR